MTESNQQKRIGVEDPQEYAIDNAMAVSIQRKAPYAMAPVSLKVTYVLVLIAAAVGVWLAVERALLPQWAQLALPVLAVVGARSAMRFAYASCMAAKYRRQLAAYAARLGQMPTGTGH